MSIYGAVAKAKEGIQNSTSIKELGEFYSIVTNTKIKQSPEKGMFVIVESKVIEVFDGKYKQNDSVAHIVKKDKKHTLFEDLIATYVSAFNGVTKGHKFSENDKENEAIWIQKSEEVFGVSTPNPAKGTFEYPNNNLLKGSVCHYKVVKDFKKVKDATDTRVQVLDEAGQPVWYPKVIVLGLVAPEQLSPELKEQYKNELHPAYK